MKRYLTLCAVVCAVLLLLPLTACSSGTSKTVQTKELSEDHAGTQIVGKVTEVVGNQVTLAVGTLNQKVNSAAAKDQKASSTESASSAAASSSSVSSEGEAEDADSGLSLTGETKTVLIPVGLSLSQGQAAGGQRSAVSKSGNAKADSQDGAPTGENEKRPGTSPAKPGGSGADAGVQMPQQTRDFSSITTGMILQITEKTLSDGTQEIVSVAVLSE
ncbi:MAG: hypothetical protein LKJ17_03980 [Oscillospiraceae bacterium]|jgi:hypothetical protein|nr:hypothetical protein [Oscillospiraceae bacterium]